MKWESGSNPELLPNAEYWPDPKKPGEGDLFFQPDRDLKGQKLKVLVLYANETLDAATVAAGRCDPKLRMPESPLPRISELAATARWVGQDGQDVTGTGDVHVRLSGLARPPAIAAAVLTDSVRGTWVYRGSDRIKLDVSQRDITGPLAIRPGADRGSFDVFFAPYRDEARSTLTLRLIDPDGRMSVARFDGGACDPGRCAAATCRDPSRGQARRRPERPGEPVRDGEPGGGDLPAAPPAGAEPAGDAHLRQARRRWSSPRPRPTHPGRRPSRSTAAKRPATGSRCGSRGQSAGTKRSATGRP